MFGQSRCRSFGMHIGDEVADGLDISSKKRELIEGMITISSSQLSKLKSCSGQGKDGFLKSISDDSRSRRS